MHAQTTLEHILLIAGGAALIAITAALLIPSGSNVYEIIRSKGGEELFPKENPADLSVILTTYPSSAKEGENYVLSFKVCNNGPGDVNYLAVVVDSLASVRKPAVFRGNLERGYCKDEYFIWAPVEPGIHVLKVGVSGNADDDRKMNNVFFVTIPVEGNETNEAGFASVSENKKRIKRIFFGDLPDLNVQITALPSPIYSRTPNSVNIRVCEDGTEKVEYNLSVSGDGDFSPNFFIGSVQGGVCNNHLVIWTPDSAGEKNINVKMEADDLNKNNNTVSLTVHVKERNQLSFSVTSYPSTAYKNLSYVISVRVCGTGQYTISFSDSLDAEFFPSNFTDSVNTSCVDHSTAWMPKQKGTHKVSVRLGEDVKTVEISVEDLPEKVPKKTGLARKTESKDNEAKVDPLRIIADCDEFIEALRNLRKEFDQKYGISDEDPLRCVPSYVLTYEYQKRSAELIEQIANRQWERLMKRSIFNKNPSKEDWLSCPGGEVFPTTEKGEKITTPEELRKKYGLAGGGEGGRRIASTWENFLNRGREMRREHESNRRSLEDLLNWGGVRFSGGVAYIGGGSRQSASIGW